jgi:hypothetical protein
MQGIWSSFVCRDTPEESPTAYKKARDIPPFIGEMVELERRLKPRHNYKAVD